MVTRVNIRSFKFPFYGWCGIALMLLFWYLSWSLPGLRTHWAFFPLWLGFCLTVDALVFLRKGHSLLTRSWKQFILLFVISIPVWWLFELVNWRTQNWIYRGRELFTDLEFALYASLCFSTVIPAMFETAELAGTFNWIKKAQGGPRIGATKTTLTVFIITGLLSLALEIIWPRIFYPFIWVTMYFLIEPLNVYLKCPSLLIYTGQKDWRPVLALFTGGLICGFFWELWNYYSFPKWQYDLPGLNVLHIFEMPLLGFLGFMAFALELYAVYHLIKGMWGEKDTYVQLVNES
jgi:hypothetical protein